MSVVVIEPAEPIITPSDVPGRHDGDDAFVTAMIAAAQSNIDGPNGWLRRAVGLQTLELRDECWDGGDLPYPELVRVVSASSSGEAVPPEDWRSARGSVVIRYEAGYEAVPASIKAALVLMTQALISLAPADGGLRGFSVDGAFNKQFNSPDLVDRVRTAAVTRLLAPFRVFA